MSKAMRGLLLLVLFLSVATGAFLATRKVRAAQTGPATAPAAGTDALMDWLVVPATQRAAIREDDPTFDQDLARLRADLAAKRSELAAALEQLDTPADQVRQRSEAVLAANAALERRVVDHLLRVRDHLSPEQRRRLFGLCAEGLRQGPGWRWRQGQGDAAGDAPPGGGRGMGWGPRDGTGRGRRADP